MAGPPTTMKSAGRMKKASGKSILIGSLRARSSARCRRLVRSRSACERSVCAMLAPSRSLWMMRPASAFRSSTPLRSPSPRSASSRVRPLRSSKATCANSRPRASFMPDRSSPMRAMAALRPRPASRQVTMRSRVSGSAVGSSCTRRVTLTRPNGSSVRTTMNTMSHLDAHDALDEDVTEEDTAEPVARHVQTRLTLHHRPEVLGVEENQGDGDEERERGQHHPGEAALRGEHPHLAQKLDALAYGVADVVEHLREVAAHLLRDHHAGL